MLQKQSGLGCRCNWEGSVIGVTYRKCTSCTAGPTFEKQDFIKQELASLFNSFSRGGLAHALLPHPIHQISSFSLHSGLPPEEISQKLQPSLSTAFAPSY
ncbi:hypothetical protein PGTUg99_030573 [Puccinia graminis f. sp. tritici]|uniref:Uncharacterized protein n=1 Tax=Puccinia graminis f. sp. tritici TaxID=56615 RepID=A0A5B0QR52_PUCGR|nr:hypothetical protein PGTUg99_030573 [Puccinia graminis f. sp. tritici]